jgi:hypothetical protein
VRQALSLVEHVWEVWLTNPKNKYNTNDEKKRSFLTLWVSEALGNELGKRSKLMVDCTSNKEVQLTNNENTNACLHEQDSMNVIYIIFGVFWTTPLPFWGVKLAI